MGRKNFQHDDLSMIQPDPLNGIFIAIVTKVCGAGAFDVAFLDQHNQPVHIKAWLRGKLKFKSNKRNNFVDIHSLIFIATRNFESVPKNSDILALAFNQNPYDYNLQQFIEK